MNIPNRRTRGMLLMIIAIVLLAIVVLGTFGPASPIPGAFGIWAMIQGGMILGEEN